MITLLNFTNVYSQGIKAGVGFSGITQRYTNPNYFRIGYDQNLGEKISVSLTYKLAFPPSNDVVLTYGFPSADGDVRFSVNHICTWNEFSFISKYFFFHNSEAGFYSASGISLLQAKNEYEVSSLSVDGNSTYTNYGDLSEGTYEQDITLIPLFLNIGYRGEFEGWYFDTYAGMGILPFGANPDVEPAALANRGVETRFAPVSFQFGITYGVSWAK
ncbi:MAG: hypothetical protein KA285_00150 [Bacteroidia bacterium]|nr:hypothetical protein [Bacteroidia bacterium]